MLPFFIFQIRQKGKQILLCACVLVCVFVHRLFSQRRRNVCLGMSNVFLPACTISSQIRRNRPKHTQKMKKKKEKRVGQERRTVFVAEGTEVRRTMARKVIRIVPDFSKPWNFLQIFRRDSIFPMRTGQFNGRYNVRKKPIVSFVSDASINSFITHVGR